MIPGGRGRGRGGRGPSWIQNSGLGKAHSGQTTVGVAPKQDGGGTSQQWWRELADEDPISLEPLAELGYPPFELHVSTATKEGNTRKSEANCWFDGRMLANYLVSTGCFLHPISRRELRSSECEALDRYLEAHCLGQACVAHTFSHKEDYTLTATPHNRVARMREEATGIVAAMFRNPAGQRRVSASGFSRRPIRQRVPALPGSGAGRRRQRQGGLTVVDDDSAGLVEDTENAWPSMPTHAAGTRLVYLSTPQAEIVVPDLEPLQEETAEEPMEEYLLATEEGDHDAEEGLPPYRVLFFGVSRRMAVESYLWSMQEQCELRWLSSPPAGLWATTGEWAVAAFESREAWREMASRLGVICIVCVICIFSSHTHVSSHTHRLDSYPQ